MRQPARSQPKSARVLQCFAARALAIIYHNSVGEHVAAELLKKIYFDI